MKIKKMSFYLQKLSIKYARLRYLIKNENNGQMRYLIDKINVGLKRIRFKARLQNKTEIK